MSACCVQVILFDQLGSWNIKGLVSQDGLILSHLGHTHPDGCFLYGVLANPFAYVAHFVFLRAVWVRTQIAAVAKQARYQYQLSNPSPCQYCFVLCFSSVKASFTA
jgi:hypothetical protein